jgi:hypothetical protein
MCLAPPVTKSPKVRGYSWHCESCDNADSDNSVSLICLFCQLWGKILDEQQKKMQPEKNRALLLLIIFFALFQDGPRFSALKAVPKEKRKSALRELDRSNSADASNEVSPTEPNGTEVAAAPSTHSDSVAV